MDLKSIYYSPSQINLQDATNGYLFCGYLTDEDFEIEQTPLVHKIFDGREFQWGTKTEFKATLRETNPELWKDLKDRFNDEIDVYIICQNCAFKFNSIYINAAQFRDLSRGGSHTIVISGTTDDESCFEIIKNLLSSVKDGFDYGGCEIDTNSDGLCDGWINSGLTCTRYSTWKYSGTYSQRLQYDQAGLDYALCRVRFPIDKFEIRITVSAQVKNVLGSTSRFDFGFRLLTAAESPSVISTHTVNHSFTGGEEKQISHSALVTPTATVGWIEIIVQTVAAPYDDVDAALDNLQIEFGSLTAYSEND